MKYFNRNSAMAAVLAATIAATPVVATAQGPSDEAAETAEKEDDQRVKCKTERVTGSRLSTRKVCRTMAEWRDQQEATRHNMRQETAKTAAAAGNQ